MSEDNCKKKTKTDCLSPHCIFTNGKTRQFCRKSKNTMKTDRESKNYIVNTKEILDKQLKKRDTAAKTITQFMKKVKTQNTIAKKLKKRDTAAKTITQFMKKVKAQNTTAKKLKKRDISQYKIGQFLIKKRANITSRFLNAVCPSSGVCIAFGKETNKIKTYFNDFINSQYRHSIKKLNEGYNGIVYEYEYHRLKYKAYTIVKMSKMKITDVTDNLMYEFFAGMYINSVYKKYPCFLETYGVNINPIPSHHKDIIFNTYTSRSLNNDKIAELISSSCQTPSNVVVQIEHIHNPLTMQKAFTNIHFWKNEILPVLFQLYYTLYKLQNEFTHYDLHADNVLLYEPISNNYILYHFHLDDGNVVHIRSRYIAKIIDYGRVYFNDKTNPNMNSESIYQKLCSIPSCNLIKNTCGSNQGYNWLYKGKGTATNYYINSKNRNASHDLRLLSILQSIYNKYLQIREVYRSGKYNAIENDINKLFTQVKYSGLYGTKELKSNNKTINNITDAYSILVKICSSPVFNEINNDTYMTKNKIGDLHIYSDRDMVFTPVV